MLLLEFCRLSDALVAIRLSSPPVTFAEWQMPARLWIALRGALLVSHGRSQVRVAERTVGEWIG